MPAAFVPIRDWNFSTNDVTVYDWGSGREVCVHRATLYMPNGVTVCIAAESLDALDGRHLVRLPNGLTAWVRPLVTPDTLGA